MKIQWFFIFLLSFCLTPLFGQTQLASFAEDHIVQQLEQWDLSPDDVSDLSISDQYTDSHNGITHIYYIQRYQGIEIFNAISGVHLKSSGKVMFSNHRFVDHLSDRVIATRQVYNAAGALSMATQTLGLPKPNITQVLSRSQHQVKYIDSEISRSPIDIRMVYFLNNSGKLQLCWNMLIEDPRSSAGWNLFVDVQSGEIVSKNDATIYCTFDHSSDEDCSLDHNTQALASKAIAKKSNPSSDLEFSDGATYFVYPASVESPLYGDRTYMINPADPIASPFGWHDTNGREGPEYTFTRGNNVHAYQDAQPDDSPDGDEPDGGEELFFDFPFTDGGNPSKYSHAVVTQLFYMNNFMHDYTHHFGFDESSGNYQQNNYGNGGNQGDPIRAEAQDGSGTNNANFLPSRDGENGRMQMFLWLVGGNSNFTVLSPANLARTYQFGAASFGPIITSSIEGELAVGITADLTPLKGCTPLINPDQISGKIALIDRGDCFFEEKVKNAEAAGAIACVICNNQDGGVQSMGNVDSIADPRISSVMISQADCALFRQALANGPVQVRIDAPDFVDSGFDNGIVAHEYAHGISTRLTGGPSRVNCLPNSAPFEQMGEGWSDFFALASTHRPGQDGNLRRPIGNYAEGQSTNGSGIRRQAYSIDPDINNQTYDDIIGTSAPHPVGEVWAATLWDLYWALIDVHGFNPDPTVADAGNNIAVQLVMDGMKLQACRPGFVDGRDAIIAADLINNNGANECIIWEAFANRGIGWSADQGSGDDRNDNIEGFNIRPECSRELSIVKSSTPLIDAGDNFTVEINISNYKTSQATGILINDLIPEGCSLVNESVKGAPNHRVSNNQIEFEIGDLSPGASKTISYTLSSSPDLVSQQIFFDDIESGPSNWSVSDITGNDIWRLSIENPNDGQRSWYIPATTRRNDQALQLVRFVPLDMNRPVLRFYHNYDIEPGIDGGIVEISTGGSNWISVTPEQYLRKPQRGGVPNSLFNKSKQKAFWGSSNQYVASYIDLSDYKGESIRFRLRYGSTEDNSMPTSGPDGWFVDDLEIMDMKHYQTQACVSSAEGDQNCVLSEEAGTIINTGLATPTNALTELGFKADFYPNPTQGNLNISIQSTGNEKILIEIVSLNGKVLQQTAIDNAGINEFKTLDLSSLPKGVYFAKIKSATRQIIEKILIQ